MAMSLLHGCQAQQANQVDLFIFLARSARHILVEEGIWSSFTLPFTLIFALTSAISSTLTSSSNTPLFNNIKTLQQYQPSSFSIQHLSKTLAMEQQNIYVDTQERQPLLLRRTCCLDALLHSFIGAALVKPLHIFACCSAACQHKLLSSVRNPAIWNLGTLWYHIWFKFIVHSLTYHTWYHMTMISYMISYDYDIIWDIIWIWYHSHVIS